MKEFVLQALSGSFDRITDTIWFNNETTVGSVTSVSQSHTRAHPIPPPVLRYRYYVICLGRSTLILNTIGPVLIAKV